MSASIHVATDNVSHAHPLCQANDDCGGEGLCHMVCIHLIFMEQNHLVAWQQD